MNSVHHAWQGVSDDQAYCAALFGDRYRVRSRLRALIFTPSLQATLLMRLASAKSGPLSQIARSLLISSFSSDVSGGCTIRGGMYIPHPIGIVIGSGVTLDGDVTLYQGVTLGGSRSGGYPHIGARVAIYPNSMVVGDVRVGADAVIGAMNFVSADVAAGETVRGQTLRSGLQ